VSLRELGVDVLQDERDEGLERPLGRTSPVRSQRPLLTTRLTLPPCLSRVWGFGFCEIT